MYSNYPEHHAVLKLNKAFLGDSDKKSTLLIDLAAQIVSRTRPTVDLILSGFFYKKGDEYILVYPLKHMLSCLYSSLKSLTSLLAKFSSGGDLEFSFFL